MSEHVDLSHVSDGQLRAWSDFGVISSARYVEEMERRGHVFGHMVVDAPSIEPKPGDLFDDLDVMAFEQSAPADYALSEALPYEALPIEAAPMFTIVERLVIVAGGLVAIAMIAAVL